MKLTLAAVRGDYEMAGRLDRAIVAKRVPILAGLGIIAGELVRDGIIPDGLANGVTHWSTVVFTVLGVAGGVLWAHQGATPADPQLQPKDKYGNDLISALKAGPHAGIAAPLPDVAGGPAGAATVQSPSAAAALAAAAAINPARQAIGSGPPAG